MDDDPGHGTVEADELLWELSELDEEGGEALELHPTLIDAYRRCELSEEKAEEVDRILMLDPGARALLVAPVESELSAGRREAVLAAVPAAVRPRWRIAAGFGVGLLALAWGFSRLPIVTDTERSLPGYEVAVTALASTRSQAEALEVAPETRVEVVVEPEESARAGVEFAIYRREGSGFVRVVDRRLTIELNRGAARITAPAELLVGRDPGRHTFWIVVAAEGELPHTLADTSSRTAGERLFAESHELIVRATEEPGIREEGGL